MIGLLAGLMVAVAQSFQSRSEQKKRDTDDPKKEKKEAADKPTAERAAAEATIRANVAAFVRAYNMGDSKAVAALFMKDAFIMDKEGNTSQGREAIQKTFAGLFKEAPKRRIEVFVESIRFIGADMAVEIGSTKETLAPGEPPEEDDYTVLHVKRDGKWLMALVREAEGMPPTSHEQLRPLAWLIGNWVDDGGSVVVNSSCRWSEDKHFLLQEFRMQVEGKEAMKVSQRIGWDPLSRHIRSWVFDSEGGFTENVWTQTADGWVIKSTGVRPDGTSASATNHLIPTGRDGYVWRSKDRVAGDEVLSPVEVKVVRKPPQPKE
jgi:uncharacterized protein (TIGR02246 family)